MKLSAFNSVSLILIIKILGVLFATFVFASFTPLVDSQKYLAGSYTDNLDLRTLIVQFIASNLNAMIGPFLTHQFFATLSVLAFIYRAIDGRAVGELIPIFILPSTLVWTSVVGKEAVFVCFFNVALILWAKYTVSSINRAEIFSVLICIFCCFCFRPHYAVVLPWIFFGSMIVKSRAVALYKIVPVSFVAIVFLIYLFAWPELLERGFRAIDPLARASRQGTIGLSLENTASFFAVNLDLFKDEIWKNFYLGVVGPSLYEAIHRIEFFPFFLEGVFIFVSPVILYAYAILSLKSVQQRQFYHLVFWICIMPAIFLLIWLHAPFGVLNPGSAIRWRTNFESMFYLAPLILYLDIRDGVNS